MSSVAAAARGPVAFECALVAHGVVEAEPADLRTLRETPGGPTSPPIPPRFLRNSDEQTVVGLAAVLRAMNTPELQGRHSDGWGILAAPRFPGRVTGAATFRRYEQGGPGTISPHIIPQHSLHSVAGAISVALGLHGPSFGIGGGPEAVAEGLTAALTFLSSCPVPGLWLVLTGWDPEPVPDGRGGSLTKSVCRGVALALAPEATAGRRLRLTPAPRLRTAGTPDSASTATTLAEVFHHFSATADGPDARPWSCDLPWGGHIEFFPRSERQRKAA